MSALVTILQSLITPKGYTLALYGSTVKPCAFHPHCVTWMSDALRVVFWQLLISFKRPLRLILFFQELQLLVRKLQINRACKETGQLRRNQAEKGNPTVPMASPKLFSCVVLTMVQQTPSQKTQSAIISPRRIYRRYIPSLCKTHAIATCSIVICFFLANWSTLRKGKAA